MTAMKGTILSVSPKRTMKDPRNEQIIILPAGIFFFISRNRQSKSMQSETYGKTGPVRSTVTSFFQLLLERERQLF